VDNAWNDGEADLVDETKFTTTGKAGWSAWNGWSPEEEFCDFAASFIRLHRPAHVIETGSGQGYTTRRIIEAMPKGGRVTLFETDRDMADVIRDHVPDWCAVHLDHPAPAHYRTADLTILDSLGKLRRRELNAWWKFSKPGAYLLTHDADDQRHQGSTNHAQLAQLIRRNRIPGVFLPNPRGGFLGQKAG